MDEEEIVIRKVRKWFIGTIIVLVMIGGVVAVLGNVYDLAWMPFRVNMQTRIVRNSNGYITAQQEALRQFAMDETTAHGDQKLAIIRQMCEIKDKIPAYFVAPDINQLLEGKCS